jgi:hypothetical protein
MPESSSYAIPVDDVRARAPATFPTERRLRNEPNPFPEYIDPFGVVKTAAEGPEHFAEGFGGILTLLEHTFERVSTGSACT